MLTCGSHQFPSANERSQPTRPRQHVQERYERAPPAAGPALHHQSLPSHPQNNPADFLHYFFPNLAPTRAGIFQSGKIEERERERLRQRREPMMVRFAGAAVAVALLLGVAGAAGQDATCARRSSPPFLDTIGSRCPFVQIEPSPPLEVRGEAVDTELNLRRRGISYSILFYAAWCPFSNKFRPIFEALSNMYPQIHHFAVEESSATPSLFSRYGVRGFPAILLVNETALVRYRGSKDLSSLVDFYKKTTGLDPVAHLDIDQQESTGSLRSIMPRDRSLREIAKYEPFLLLAVLFIVTRVVAHFVPTVLSYLRAFLAVRVHNLNLGIHRGSNQLVERALNVLDMKRLWSKLRLSNKATDLRKSASNARAWASSFASVSLGESSSSRQSSRASNQDSEVWRTLFLRENFRCWSCF